LIEVTDLHIYLLKYQFIYIQFTDFSYAPLAKILT